MLLELLLAGGCDIERSADPSVSGSFGWNQSRFKGPSSSSSWVLRVLCVCVGLIMRVEEPSISMDGNATWCV